MLNNCKIVVFPEYHSMGRLINTLNNKQTGRIINNELFCIEGAPVCDNFCISSWFWGEKLAVNSGKFNIEASGDKKWNNLILQGKSGIANVFVNGKHIKKIGHIKGASEDGVYLRASQTTSDSPPLRDFRYYERSLSEMELEDLLNISFCDSLEALGFGASYLEVYASNIANMFPTHF